MPIEIAKLEYNILEYCPCPRIRILQSTRHPGGGYSNKSYTCPSHAQLEQFTKYLDTFGQYEESYGCSASVVLLSPSTCFRTYTREDDPNIKNRKEWDW